MKYIQTIALGLSLMLASLATHASPDKLLSHLQHMRLTSISSMSNFFMFSGLNADQKYERRMMKDLAAFTEALEAAKGLVAGGTPSEHMGKIESDWNAYMTKLAAHQKVVADMGKIDITESMALGLLGNNLSASITKAYADVAAVNSPNPTVQQARDLAVLLQEITTQYAALGTAGKTEFHTGEYKRSLAEMADSFSKDLSSLSNTARNASTNLLLDDISSKWSMLSKSMNTQNGNGVPFLIISYNDRIIHHLEELEGMIR